MQEKELHETRSILLNTSLSKVKAENDELRQSVRIADNELKIIGLREEVISFTPSFYSIESYRIDSTNYYTML